MVEMRIRLIHMTTVPESLGFFTGQVQYMKTQGIDVRVLSSPGTYLEKFAIQENIPSYAVEMARRITPLRDLLSVIQIWFHFRKVNPTIVHAHTPKGGLLGMIGSWLAQTPVRIYHIHGLPVVTATGYKRLLLRVSELVSCRLAHQVLCVSESVRNVAIKEKFVPAEKVKVLGHGSINGIDAEKRFNPARNREMNRSATRKRYNIPQNAPVIGFVGRIVKDKGIVELAEAWKILRETFPQAHLIMCGTFEPQDPIPPDVEAFLHNDERIHLPGFIDDMPAVYQAMDIFVLPSYREGFPIAPLEASAMSIPIVATRIPGCVDAIKDGVTGTLVPPYDSMSLAKAIEYYLNNPKLAFEHAKAARERVLSEFTQEGLWTAQFEEYKRLLNEKGLTNDNEAGYIQ